MKQIAIALAGLCLALGSTGTRAADFPDKPLRMIVPASPGGAADTLARMLGQEMGKALGKSVVIENRTGAAGIIGMQALAKSPADGYTLGMVFAGAMAVNPSMYKPLPYDANKDFDPVALVAVSPLVLVASTKSDVKSLPELVEKARKSPGKYSFGSTGIGSTQHLSPELLKASYDIDLLHVPYKGSGAAMTDLMGGQIQLVSDNAISLIQPILAGQVVPLAVESPRRLASLPNVPTTTELGFPKFQAAGWYGVVAPAGMPPEVMKKVVATVDEVLRRPAMEQALQQQGMEPQPGTPADFRNFILAEQEKWAGVMRAAKVPTQDLR